MNYAINRLETSKRRHARKCVVSLSDFIKKNLYGKLNVLTRKIAICARDTAWSGQ
jgi:hypothetical protein